MKFDIISIVFLLIIIAFALLGLKKGFFKTLTSLIKNILSFVLAVLLCKPIASLLNKSSLGESLTSKFIDFFNSKGGIFAATITEGNKQEVINTALKEINIPEGLNGFLSALLNKMIPITGEATTVSESLAPTISYYIFIGIAFVVLFIIIRIIVLLLNRLFALIEQIPFVGTLNMILGGIINGIIGIILVCFITYIFTFIVPTDTGASTWLVSTMCLDEPDVFTLSKFFYENNFLLALIAIVQKWFV